MMIVLSREFREKFKFRRNDMSWQRQLLKILDIWIFSSRLFASLISLIESHRLPFSIFCIMSASFVMKWAIQLLFVWKQQRIYNSWEKKTNPKVSSPSFHLLLHSQTWWAIVFDAGWYQAIFALSWRPNHTSKSNIRVCRCQQENDFCNNKTTVQQNRKIILI